MTLIGRLIVGLLIAGSGLKALLDLAAIVLLIRSPRATEEAIGTALGVFVFSACVVLFFVWLFRKIGGTKHDAAKPPPLPHR